VFNIRLIENRENAKYSTKNNIRESPEVFLATKNHNRARTISRSILMLIAARRCIVRLEGSFLIPLRKIQSISNTIAEKENVRIANSLKVILILIKASRR
jgi:hypothetical protein